MTTALEFAAALAAGTATVAADETTLSWDSGAWGPSPNGGACWPDTALTLQMGEWSLDVPVWLVAGYGHHTGCGGGWAYSHSDGQCSGRPQVRLTGDDEDGYAVQICGGDNIGGAPTELAAGHDEDAAQEAADAIEAALDAAYDQISVLEPSADDIDVDDGPDAAETIYALLPTGPRYVEAVALSVCRYDHPFAREAELDEADRAKAPQAWTIRAEDSWLGRGRISASAPPEALADLGRYDSVADAREALSDRLADLEREYLADLDWLTPGQRRPTLYDYDDAAREALCRWAEREVEEYAVPVGMTVDRDDDGLYLADAQDQRYHPDLDGLLACVEADSWHPAVEAAVGTLSRRATTDALHARADEADRILAERGDHVWVSIADSIAAGNCPRGTADFAARIRGSLQADGALGAVSAATVLSLRDDGYTRRACRAAALRQEA